MTTMPWRADPALSGRFHAQHPDDLQIMVHDGEPRRTKLPPEACWVRLSGVHGTLRMPIASADAQPPIRADQVRWEERAIYTGTLLNAPQSLRSVRQGDAILVVASKGLPFPLHVTPTYVSERSGWSITPCNKCGADQTLDPMTVMARTRFPDAPPGAVPVAFSAFCGCGGTMMLASVQGTTKARPNEPDAPPKPWWKFW